MAAKSTRQEGPQGPSALDHDRINTVIDRNAVKALLGPEKRRIRSGLPPQCPSCRRHVAEGIPHGHGRRVI